MNNNNNKYKKNNIHEEEEEESDILLHKSKTNSDIINYKEKQPNKEAKNLINISNNTTALKENELLHDRSRSLVDKRDPQVNSSIKPKIEEQNVHQQIYKKHKYFPMLHFLAFLMCIVILYFSVVFHKNLQEMDLTYFIRIGENWKKSPLQIVYRGTGNCEKPEDNVLADAWPGLQQGCECDGKIYKGECPKNKANCVPMPKFEKQKFTFWQANNLCAYKKTISNTNPNTNLSVNLKSDKNKNLINGTNLISNAEIKKAYVNYFDLEVSDRTTKTFDFCPLGLKNCGIIDSLGNFLCIAISESCPVNNINIKNYMFNKKFSSNDNNNLKINEITNLQLFSDSNYSKNEKTLKITNAVFEFSNYFNPFTSKIPVEFITSFDQPCKNPYFINANFYVFYLDPFYGKQKCLQYSDDINPNLNLFTFNNKNYKKIYYSDPSYALLDKYPYRSLLIDNKIYEKFSIVPVSFKDQLSQNIGLYAKNYFGINAKCHKEIKEKKLASKVFSALENLNNISAMIPSVLAILSLDVINMAFLVYFFIISVNLNSKRLDEVNQANYLSVKFFMLFLLIVILSFIAIFVIGVVNAVSLISLRSLDALFGNRDCVDYFTYDIYLKYFSMINTGIVLMVVTFCFSLVLFVVYILYFLSFVKNHEVKFRKEE